MPISSKKWFLTKNEELVDLNSVSSIHIEMNGNTQSENKFLVVSNTCELFGEFETLEEAKEYIKKIHLFLVAQ